MSSVTKKLMAAGDCTVDLSDDTPLSVTDSIGVLAHGFASLIVTPAWYPDPSLVDFGDSVYTGVLRRQSGRTHFSGAHATIWLGDEDGKGNLAGAVSATQNLSNWVTDVLAFTPLTKGTVTSTSTLEWIWPGVTGDVLTARDALDYLADHYGYEWRVRDDLIVDVRSATNLYGAAATIFSPVLGGRDFTYLGVHADITLTEDVEDYSTRAVVLWDNAGTPDNTGADAPATPYDDPNGDPVILKRIVQSSNDTKKGWQATALANREAARFASIRQSATVKTDHPCIMAELDLEPVYLWEPEQGCYDMTVGPLYFRGHTLFPLLTRVTGITMNLSRGMGVYVRHGDGTVIDLTPYMDWAAPGATIEVGDQQPSLSRAMTRRAGVRTA